MTLEKLPWAAEGKMRGYVFGLLLLAVGCAGKNTVAGQEKTKAQQLEESLPSWCESACKRINACADAQDCACNGDSCSCPSADKDCAKECQAAMGRYADAGEACAAIGQRFQGCIDHATCAQLFTDASCNPTKEERAQCPETDDVSDNPPMAGSAGSTSVGDDPGPPQPSSGGASAAGGASNGGPNGGGSNASGGAVGEPAPVTCQGNFGSGPTPDNTSTNEICEGGAVECNDGHEYRYLCARTSDGQAACSCLVDDGVTGAFDPGTTCPTQAVVNAGCHWNILF